MWKDKRLCRLDRRFLRLFVRCVCNVQSFSFEECIFENMLAAGVVYAKGFVRKDHG